MLCLSSRAAESCWLRKTDAVNSVVHVIPGLDDPTCGIAVAAKQLMARGYEAVCAKKGSYS